MSIDSFFQEMNARTAQAKILTPPPTPEKSPQPGCSHWSTEEQKGLDLSKTPWDSDGDWENSENPQNEEKDDADDEEEKDADARGQEEEKPDAVRSEEEAEADAVRGEEEAEADAVRGDDHNMGVHDGVSNILI